MNGAQNATQRLLSPTHVLRVKPVPPATWQEWTAPCDRETCRADALWRQQVPAVGPTRAEVQCPACETTGRAA